MTQLFNRTVSAPPVSVGGDAGISTLRFILGHYGESPRLLVSNFWLEQHGAHCTPVPVFAVEVAAA